MKALVFHAVGDIRLDDVPDPQLQEPTDAIVRLTSSAICGTDLHFVRGTMAGMKEGTILGHEGVGVVEELGEDVRGYDVGDRVVICSTIGCGTCSYCRAGYFSQCDRANPNGPEAGTSFFGGPEQTGPIDGLQAERARIPFAQTTMVKLPHDVSDEQAIPISDIFPTGWFGARLAEVGDGDVVAVFGAGPVGQFAVLSAWMQNAGRVLCVDHRADRLAAARHLGAEAIDFSREDPVETLRRLTGGIGPDRVIDAVGVDAEGPEDKPELVEEVAPDRAPHDGQWRPGNAPDQVARWAVEAVAKAGTIGVIGVYPPTMERYPIGAAMNKNLTLKLGNCNHRRYVPELVEMTRAGLVEPAAVLTQLEDIVDVERAYEAFDRRDAGWLKVELEPTAAGRA
ncbi:MAG TPA: zinc-dependent alcohol dehydrogenase [Solirubrobacterales bacterium]|nr:zinc-dependent alcohol dehydrogenase [Solirubrobacterales bacterium]